MTNYYIRPGSAVGGGTGRAEWAPNTAYAIGDRVVCRQSYNTNRRWYVYECTTGGTSHGTTEPTWPNVVGNTVNDNGVIWTTRTATSWANATIYISYFAPYQAFTTYVAGDRIWIKNDLDDTTGNAAYFAFGSNVQPGSLSNPIYWISTDDTANEPPQTRVAGAKFKNSGYIEWYGACQYFYGIEFYAGYGASSGTPGFGYAAPGQNTYTVFEDCLLKLAYAASGSTIQFGMWSNFCVTEIRYINTDFEFTHASQKLTVSAFVGVTIEGGTILGTPPTNLISTTSGTQTAVFHMTGMDLSLVTGNLIDATNMGCMTLRITRCKLNAAVTPIVNAGWRPSVFIQVDGCDAGTNTFRIAKTDYGGTLIQEVTYIREDGASDGETPIAWKMVTNANANKLTQLCSPWITLWNETTGSSKTFTVEILRDNATNLKDTEVWLEVLVLTDANFPQAALVTDGVHPVLAGSDQASSSVTWVTTGMTNPNKQKLSVTATPAMKGVVQARVCLAKVSTTIYVDPMITVS